MISWIYWGINLMVVLLILRCICQTRSFKDQLVGGMVLIPLLLRAFFIK